MGMETTTLNRISKERYNKQFKRLSHGQKAVVTRLSRYGTLGRNTSSKKSQQKNYNATHKNDFRNKVIDSFNEVGERNDLILALETDQWLYTTQQGRKYEYMVYEHNPQVFKRMMVQKPEHLLLCSGSIKEFANVKGDSSPKFAFLDFCATLGTLEPTLEALSDSLKGCKKIAFTFAVRNHKSVVQGHKAYVWDIVLRTMRHFNNFSLERPPTVYKDGGLMVGFIITQE